VWKFIEARAEELICAVLIFAMATIVMYSVINRSVFGAAIAWADEMAIYCLIWSTYLGSALAVRERVHIRVLNAILAFPKPVSTWLVYLSDLIWVAFNLTLVYQGFKLIEFMWGKPFVSAAMGISQKWPYLIVPLAFGLMTVRLAQVYWQYFRHGRDLLTPLHGHEFEVE